MPLGGESREDREIASVDCHLKGPKNGPADGIVAGDPIRRERSLPRSRAGLESVLAIKNRDLVTKYCSDIETYGSRNEMLLGRSVDALRKGKNRFTQPEPAP